MSNIPEDIMGKEEQGELGAKKPDFGIFEKMEKGLDDTAGQVRETVSGSDAADKIEAEVTEAADSAEVNVEKIMDSRTRKSMMETMEIEPVKADDAVEEKAGEIADNAQDTADAAEETAEEVADKGDEAVDEEKDAVADEAQDAAEDETEAAAGKAKDIFSKAKAEDVPADPRDVLKNKIESTKRKKGWHVLLIELIVIALAVIITFTLILGSSTVKGTSMEPNYFEGDRVLYSRVANNFEQNDVIIFHTDENRDLIKRVIAVEGDVVDIDDGEVLVNGTPVETLNVSQDTEESVSGVSDPVKFPLTVKKDHVFVLGDNRSVSIDSRTKKIGQISKKDIAGRVFYMMRSKTK